jgi:hypothetical protein
MAGIYMLFALSDYQGGFDEMVGMVIFQPIVAGIVTVLTIIICFIAGLPIRLNKGIYNWWTNKIYIPILGICCGMGLLILSFFPYFLQATTVIEPNGEEITRTIPSIHLVLTGWFLVAFSTLHLFPPLFISKRIDAALSYLRSKNKNGL